MASRCGNGTRPDRHHRPRESGRGNGGGNLDADAQPSSAVLVPEIALPSAREGAAVTARRPKHDQAEQAVYGTPVDSYRRSTAAWTQMGQVGHERTIIRRSRTSTVSTPQFKTRLCRFTRLGGEKPHQARYRLRSSAVLIVVLLAVKTSTALAKVRTREWP